MQIEQGDLVMTESLIHTDTEAETTIGEDRIRARAYELYLMRNGAPGDAESDWYRAEAELRGDAAEPA
jgi:hypothetical protein